MNNLFPSLDNIKSLKVQPTDGEWHLLNYFLEHLSDKIEIYFQPFLNGDMPDIILMSKDIGVTIIEVKDWNLSKHYLDDKGDWHVKHNNSREKSPFQQVFQYKDNMFNLHINGLLEKKILNNKFYGRINVFVYFHNANTEQLKIFYQPLIKTIEQNIAESKNDNMKSYFIKQHAKLLKQRDYYSICSNSLNKIKLPQEVNNLFPESIYKEFHRYLQPPFHTVEQGIVINYSEAQKELSNSEAVHRKIKGVAGSGKTLILAKRAVNAHIRTDERVLILTFNITLTSYIHDMISNVRAGFGWNNFYITNYHQLITQVLNNLGMIIDVPNDTNNIANYLEEHYYSNINLFDDKINDIQKYKSIFIDEIQDYKVEWIRIIKKYFLEEDGEFIVFGDEKQNIYDRILLNDKTPNTTIIGRWNKLKESFRLDTKIASIAENFQEVFFKDKYENDKIETSSVKQAVMNFDKNIIKSEELNSNDLHNVVSKIFNIIKENDMHPNDICILSYEIGILREIDFIIRHDFNEKTTTTFETKEVLQKLEKIHKDKKMLKSELEHVRRVKKIGFRLNNGMLKILTIQSFKGWEIPTLFLIIDNNFEETVYTAITRARHNIIIFDKENGKYHNFFLNFIS